jgi:hypothetical protein
MGGGGDGGGCKSDYKDCFRSQKIQCTLKKNAKDFLILYLNLVLYDHFNQKTSINCLYQPNQIVQVCVLIHL